MSIKAFEDEKIANIPVISGEPKPFKGEICYSTNRPGEGWVECNGKNGTIDTRETRLFGTPNDDSLGERVNDSIGRHKHVITESTGVSFPETYLTNKHIVPAKTMDGTGASVYDFFNVVEDSTANPNDFTRTTTFYVRMWMYVGE